MTVSTFITWFSRFDVNRQVRVEQAVTRSWKIDRLVGQAHEVIVDVAEPVRQLLGDLRELAARQPADASRCGSDHPAQRRRCRA